MIKKILSLIFFLLCQKSFGSFDPVISVDLDRSHSLISTNPGWHLKQIGLTPILEKASSNNRAVTIAVIDSGIDFQHPLFKNHIYKNLSEIPNNGIDDDKNGFIDDYQGFNFINHSSDATDDNGHGTHVSGIIAADCDYQESVCGILKKVNILPLKFLNKEGRGSTSAAVEAIYYAIKMNVDVINASFGSDEFSVELYQAIKAAEDKGIIFVTAAGNYSNNNDLVNIYPANFNLSNVIAVSATDVNDQLDFLSNFGPTTVTVAAPGKEIKSTFLNGKFETLNGTSMATPIVSSVVGLMKQANKKINPKMIKSILKNSCDQNDNLMDKIACHGRINIAKAVLNPNQ